MDPETHRLLKMFYDIRLDWHRNHPGEPISKIPVVMLTKEEFRLLRMAPAHYFEGDDSRYAMAMRRMYSNNGAPYYCFEVPFVAK